MLTWMIDHFTNFILSESSVGEDEIVAEAAILEGT